MAKGKATVVLFVPDDKTLLDDGSCGARPPTAGRVIRQRRVHASNDFGDPTCPVAVCVACGEPWPCPEKGAVEVEYGETWVGGHRMRRDALVLANGGKPVGHGIDWLSRATRLSRSWVQGDMQNLLRGVDLPLVCQYPGKLLLVDDEGREVPHGD